VGVKVVGAESQNKYGKGEREWRGRVGGRSALPLIWVIGLPGQRRCLTLL